MRRWPLVIAIVMWSVLAVGLSRAVATDLTADVVLGQVGFTYGAENLVDAAGLDHPLGVAIDASIVPNRVYVADTNNHRILGWADVTALVTGAPADLVIGQPDAFTSAPSYATLTWIVKAAKADGRKIEIVVTNSTKSTTKLKKDFDPKANGYKLITKPKTKHSIALELAS